MPVPSRRLTRALLVVAAALLVAGASLLSLLSPPAPAGATVTPAIGYHATVLGWSSWYGSYRMGSLGAAYCIDHGIHAPDPAFAYVPVSAPDVDADTGASIAWIVTVHPGDDPIEAAALMLAVHDLRRARYPFGVMDVDALRPTDLAGFGGHEAEVIARARSFKAEARAHAGLRGPLHVSLTLTPTGEPATSAVAVDGRAVVTVTDGNGRPVAGAGVALEAQRATVDGSSGGGTGADGTFARGYRLDPGPAGATATFTAHALAPSPVPAVYASSTTRAQRVVRASWIGLEAHAATTPPTTSTTSTTSTSTSTTSTSTSTSTTSTSTTSTSTSTTSTSSPTPTTAPVRPTIPPTTTSTVPRPSPRTPGMLPRTGARSTGLALVGAGLVLLGTTLVAASRPDWGRHRQ